MREILAPCGGFESLSAALNAGADAVYVGMKRFSARKNAENFDDKELNTAALECHKRGVKLYVALNTLVYDSELNDFADCVRAAAAVGADGLIVQDIGAARLAGLVCPDMPLHASTQMSLNSVCGVLAAERLGFSRVVIGRELSAREIENIAAKVNAEIEVFVHGALCVCVSGQCYLSSILGGRSGNRGLCAQPCRLDFTEGGRHNVISLKDGSIIDHLNDSEMRRVASFKIEGRMKRPEYVACAVDACRKSLSGLSYDAERLGGIFSRGGLTESYYNGSMFDMNGIREREDVENSARALVGIKELYKSEFPRIRVDISAEICEGKPICAKAVCEFGNAEFSSGVVPEAAMGKPVGSGEVSARLGKLGGTQFFPGEISVSVGEGLYVSAAALNALRRGLCAELDRVITDKLTPKYKICSQEFSLSGKKAVSSGKVRFRAEVSTEGQLKQALALDFELVYAPIGLLSERTPDKDRVVVSLPLILTDCESETRTRLAKLRELGFTKGLAHTLGAAELLRQCGFDILGGYRMNVLNSMAAEVCAELGFKDITLSFEGTGAVLSEINSPIPRGILAYGKIPLMLMRRCPIADGKPCGRVNAFGEGTSCGGKLKDRQGNTLPVLCGGNCVELLNPDVLILSDKQGLLEKFDFAVMKFTVEDNVSEVLEMYKRFGKPDGKLTRGLYFRGAE